MSDLAPRLGVENWMQFQQRLQQHKNGATQAKIQQSIDAKEHQAATPAIPINVFRVRAEAVEAWTPQGKKKKAQLLEMAAERDREIQAEQDAAKQLADRKAELQPAIDSVLGQVANLTKFCTPEYAGEKAEEFGNILNQIHGHLDALSPETAGQLADQLFNRVQDVLNKKTEALRVAREKSAAEFIDSANVAMDLREGQQ